MQVRSKHYHGGRGCVRILKEKKIVEGEHTVKTYLCITHNKECCRCGYEWGHHVEGQFFKLIKSDMYTYTVEISDEIEAKSEKEALEIFQRNLRDYEDDCYIIINRGQTEKVEHE